ncbi:hypothetical protein [Jannaschia sp. R86511]|uniref:hypothetical protein n=1 Tax=Jannaschia sp. R86511 TaxID=3093853 RepID=UPI0036D31F72
MSADRPGGTTDPAAQLRLAAEQQARTRRALAPDERLLFGAWGIAWFVGFGVMWLATPLRDGGPIVAVPGLAVGLLFFVLLVTAGVVTAVHSVRAGRGVTGASARTGAMYGWGWFLGFAMLPCIVLSAQRLGASPETLALLWPAVSGLIVGLLYVGGAAAFDEPLQFGIGAWIIVTTGAGCLLGLPGLYLVMGLAGGGGFLATAAWFALRGRGRAPSDGRT